MYPFSISRYSDLATHLESVVPIQWRKDNSLEANAGMRFDPQSYSVIIEYKDIADEVIDVAHELIHVEMFFEHGFRQLAWGTPPPSQDTQKLVYHLRNIVDDTCVFGVLHKRFNVFPLSPIFFDYCKKDRKKRKLHLAEKETGQSCTAVSAWRIRMAELAVSEFEERIKPDQKKLVKEFLTAFKSPSSEVAELLKIIRKSVNIADTATVSGHSDALIAVREYFGVSSSVIHLVAFQKEAAGHILKQV